MSLLAEKAISRIDGPEAQEFFPPITTECDVTTHRCQRPVPECDARTFTCRQNITAAAVYEKIKTLITSAPIKFEYTAAALPRPVSTSCPVTDDTDYTIQVRDDFIDRWLWVDYPTTVEAVTRSFILFHALARWVLSNQGGCAPEGYSGYSETKGSRPVNANHYAWFGVVIR